MYLSEINTFPYHSSAELSKHDPFNKAETFTFFGIEFDTLFRISFFIFIHVHCHYYLHFLKIVPKLFLFLGLFFFKT